METGSQNPLNAKKPSLHGKAKYRKPKLYIIEKFSKGVAGGNNCFAVVHFGTGPTPARIPFATGTTMPCRNAYLPPTIANYTVDPAIDVTISSIVTAS